MMLIKYKKTGKESKIMIIIFEWVGFGRAGMQRDYYETPYQKYGIYIEKDIN